MIIGLYPDGRLYTNRGQSWFRTSRGVLQSDLATGCYPEGGPRPVSSVRLLVAAHTPQPTLDRLQQLLAKAGWPKERITEQRWPDPPHAPSDLYR